MATILEQLFDLLRVYPGLKDLTFFLLFLLYLRVVVVVLERLLTQESAEPTRTQERHDLTMEQNERWPVETGLGNSKGAESASASTAFPQG